MKVITQKEQAQVEPEFAQALALILNQKQKPILLMLSGGSALAVLDQVNPKSLHSQICITVLDERFSVEPETNNWLQVKATNFYQRAIEAGCEFIETVPQAEESLEAFAHRWDQDLQHWIRKHPHRKVVATVGIGTDGHIAGISPFPETPGRFIDFYFTTDWVKGYSGNLKPAERVTVTAKFMEDKIDHALVYAVGESKRAALQAVLADAGKMANTPARILREMKAVQIFTDLLVSS